jgi:hypothetical protein
MAFKVERGVAAVAVILVDELLRDLGARRPRSLVVRIDVVDVDVEPDRLAALLLVRIRQRASDIVDGSVVASRESGGTAFARLLHAYGVAASS